jgi:hypothetical protein
MDNNIRSTSNVECQLVSESLISYPEKNVERQKNALGALESAADSHGCQGKLAPGLRLRASTAPALKQMEISHTR